MAGSLVRYDTRIIPRTFPLNYECTPNKAARRISSCFENRTTATNDDERRVRFKTIENLSFLAALIHIITLASSDKTTHEYSRAKLTYTLPLSLYADSRLEILLEDHTSSLFALATLFGKFHE